MKVSVIVLTYSQEQTIRRTLDSILAQQTDFSFEIIIGEDASPNDNTRAICQSYADKYENVRLLEKAPNKGLLRNYADCTKECRGEYIACCAGDDWWHNPLKLQKQVTMLAMNSNCVLCYSGVKVVDMRTATIYDKKAIPPPRNLKENILRGNFFHAVSVCYRAEMLKCIDFDEFINQGFKMEDYPMWIIMAQYGEFCFIDEPLACYTHAYNSASNFNSYDDIQNFEQHVLTLKQYYNTKFGYNLKTHIDKDYHLALSLHALRLNMRKTALNEMNIASNLLHLSVKELIKRFVYTVPFFFRLYRYRFL